jgi:hypothetical protein
MLIIHGGQVMESKKKKKKNVSGQGLGPNNKNTLKNSLNFCQIFCLLKLLTNISD